MLIKLIRNKPQGNAIFGQLLVDGEKVSEFQSFKLKMYTLEHTDYAIPTGFYRLRMTYSPKFKEILPLLDGVIGYHQAKGERLKAMRQGIRIHAGNTIADTTGCVLVGDEAKGERLLSSRKALNRLLDYLLNYQKQNPNDEIYIEIVEADAYPLYDVPCPPEEQMR